MATKISWTNETWNPLVGCSLASPGCTNCYAMNEAWRKSFNVKTPQYRGVVKQVKGHSVWTGEVHFVEHKLRDPLGWRRPRMVFVNSMSDLFHESVPDEWIDRIFAVMALAPQHTFQVLTKRAERMRQWFGNPDRADNVGLEMLAIAGKLPYGHRRVPWPLPNVWLGVSAEDQERWNERKAHLRNTPAVVRFASFEPLLGKIVDANFADYIAWGIIGGESGGGARQTWAPDVRKLARQLRRDGVRTYVKQLGSFVTDRNDAGFEGCDPTEWPDIDPANIEHDINGFREEYQGAPCRIRLKDRKGSDPAEWPEDLRIREFPGVPS
jgi:protein gp37